MQQNNITHNNKKGRALEKFGFSYLNHFFVENLFSFLKLHQTTTVKPPAASMYLTLAKLFKQFIRLVAKKQSIRTVIVL